METIHFDDHSNKVYIKFLDQTFQFKKKEGKENLILEYGSSLPDDRAISILKSFDKFILLHQQQWFAFCQLPPNTTIEDVTEQIGQRYPDIKRLDHVYTDDKTEFTYGFCDRNSTNFIAKSISEGHKFIGTNSPDWIPNCDCFSYYPFYYELIY